MKPTVSASLLRAARSSGVRPCLSGWFRSAPASTISCATPFWPFMQAQLSAVSPSWSAEDRVAPGGPQTTQTLFSDNRENTLGESPLSPFNINSSTVLVWPSAAARISALRPCLSLTLISAPCFRSNSTTWNKREEKMLEKKNLKI